MSRSRVREAFALGAVVVAAIVVLGGGDLLEHADGDDLVPLRLAPGGQARAAEATWGPLTLTDVTRLHDPDDPLPDGARIVEAAIPYATGDDALGCAITGLAEQRLHTRGAPDDERAWAPEVATLLDDEVERSATCGEQDELRAVFLVPGDAREDLVVTVRVTAADAAVDVLLLSGTL
ncbi:hypothetical protein [Microbacterium marinilacus]|uniref:hypothetical protein n=1 Tax=Microbacterium marinilacus TaxID=415209 RepID=UPI001C8E810C|nr:hypothetical protein [Microbacterium marinilacus]MBY0689737.1 hypothetical protein [Microbacterium marinilacus]